MLVYYFSGLGIESLYVYDVWMEEVDDGERTFL